MPFSLFNLMAGSTGLEPAASAVTGQRSNQLNYDPALRGCAEARCDLGPYGPALPFPDWRGALVGSAGLEPATSCL